MTVFFFLSCCLFRNPFVLMLRTVKIVIEMMIINRNITTRVNGQGFAAYVPQKKQPQPEQMLWLGVGICMDNYSWLISCSSLAMQSIISSKVGLFPNSIFCICS